MAKQILNIGSSANDGSGTTLRAGGDLINDNFNEIYTTFGDGTNLSSPVPHKTGGTNFTDSLIIGHSTTGTLNSALANTGVGSGSLKRITTGDNNTMIGYNSGQSILGGRHNTGLGRESANGITSGLYNINIGYQSGQNITSGDGNVIIGAVIDADSPTGNRTLKIAGHDGTTTTTWISGNENGHLTFPDHVYVGNDLYLNSDLSRVTFGSNYEIKLTHVHDTGLLFTNDNGSAKLQFEDPGEYIAGDGTNLTIASSGKTIIDSTGDIELDSASSVIDFIGNGTVYGNVALSGSDLIIKSRLTDGDMSFRGNDGGSEVVALALDMSNAGAATFNSNVIVGGDLTVNGTTTTVNSTNTTLDDNLLELNSGATSNANDSGIIIERGSTGDNAIFVWDESADKFILGTTTATASDTGNLSITTGTLVANIEGNITGNITTATALATGRTIGMTGDVVWTSASFDGSGNVTGTSALQANTVSSTELVSATTLLILDSSGSTLKTIIGAGS